MKKHNLINVILFLTLITSHSSNACFVAITQPDAYIKASNTDSNDSFGTSIAIDDNEFDNSLINSGAAYIFNIEANLIFTNSFG